MLKKRKKKREINLKYDSILGASSTLKTVRFFPTYAFSKDLISKLIRNSHVFGKIKKYMVSNSRRNKNKKLESKLFIIVRSKS
jgi:hypothetical protein